MSIRAVPAPCTFIENIAYLTFPQIMLNIEKRVFQEFNFL